MNEKKIAFIICVNDEIEFQEALNYIEALNVPDGYSTDVIAVREAPSMAAGYNAAMQNSDAKYKIYIHQDVFLIYKELLRDLISLFQNNDQIGMVGVLGCRVLPENAYAIERWDTGKVLCNGLPNHFNGYENKKGYSEVMGIDGMFMATQYDIPWREDLFDGWDFYDISQACEFIRSGKKVVVPYQREYWTMHDNKACKLKAYDFYRKKFVESYQDIYPMKWLTNSFNEREEYELIKEKTYNILSQMIENGQIDEACKVFRKPENRGHMVLREIELICKIYAGEKQGEFGPSIYYKGMTYSEVYYRFLHLRHLLQRIEFLHGNKFENFKEIESDYSTYAVAVMIIAFAYNSRKVYKSMLKWYEERAKGKYQEFLKYIKIFDKERMWKPALDILKNGEKINGKRHLIVTSALTSDSWNLILKKYDTDEGCIFVEKKKNDFDMDVVKHAMVVEGNITKLICQEQEKIYYSYSKVDIYGEELEEYVKIFQNTQIPVRWHIKGRYKETIKYSLNIKKCDF